MSPEPLFPPPAHPESASPDSVPLELRVAGQPLHRIGRWPDPWQPPDWAHAHSDGTFGNRFDDPQAYYRVLYTSGQRLGCFLETLARFRPDLTLLAEFAEIEGEDDFTPLATVPASWLVARLIGTAEAQGEFADIYAPGWIALLRRELASTAVALGLSEIDASTLQAGRPRQLTQEASLVVFRRGLDGIFYRSRYGHSIENWAIFEPFPLHNTSASAIAADDPDLHTALQLHGLTMTEAVAVSNPSGT
ncbi:MAG TPA: RES domain-containing protein [Acidobacteriaceae bacterium]